MVQSHLSGCTWNKMGLSNLLTSPIHPLNRWSQSELSRRGPRSPFTKVSSLEMRVWLNFLNALVQIQDGREKLNHISKRLAHAQTLYESSSLSHGSYRTNTGQSLSWIDRFVSVVTKALFGPLFLPNL